MVQKFSTIRQIVRIRKASPIEVFDALMNSKKHTEFTGSTAKISSRVGGSIEAWDGYISGKNLELVRGKKIVQEWKTTEWPEGYPSSRLEITLTVKGEDTELKMVHSQVPAEQSKEYREGWKSAYWVPLNAYFQAKS